MYLKHAMQHPAYGQQTEAARKVYSDKLARLEAQAKLRSETDDDLPEDVETIRAQLEKDLVRRPEKAFIHRLPDDILLEIARHGLSLNEDLPAKMGKVCRRWRSLILNTPSMWSSLCLRRNKAVEKAKVYVERSRDNLTTLVIAEDLTDDFVMVMDVLKTTIPKLRRCQIDVACAGLRLRRIIRFARGLRYLSLSRSEIHLPSLSHLTQLETLKLSRPHGLLFESDWVSNDTPTQEFLDLKTLQIEWDADSPTLLLQASVLSMLKAISRICDLELKSRNGMVFEELRRNEPTTEVVTLQAVRFSVPGFFRCWPANTEMRPISLPMVEHLDLRYNPPSVCKTILSDSVPTLSNLTYLDISHIGSLSGRHDCFPLSMIDTLRKMDSLRYLNVSFTDLTDAFFEALTPTTEKDDFVLPTLIALSAAGNPQLTAAPIRDLVMSRLGPDAPTSSARKGLEKKAPAPVASGAFRPLTTGTSTPRSNAAPAKGRQKRKAGDLDDLLGSGGSQSRSRVVPPKAPSGATSGTAPKPHPGETAKGSASLPHAKAIEQEELPLEDVVPPSRPAPQRIQWLCLDHCEKIEAALSNILSPHMRFISLQTFGGIVEDRVQGTGRYRWDVE